MGDLLRLLNAPCRDIAALVSAGMDTTLTRPERWAVRIHLLYCGACRAYRGQIRLLRGLVRLLAEQVTFDLKPADGQVTGASPPVLSPEARQRLRQVLSGS